MLYQKPVSKVPSKSVSRRSEVMKSPLVMVDRKKHKEIAGKKLSTHTYAYPYVLKKTIIVFCVIRESAYFSSGLPSGARMKFVIVCLGRRQSFRRCVGRICRASHMTLANNTGTSDTGAHRSCKFSGCKFSRRTESRAREKHAGRKSLQAATTTTTTTRTMRIDTFSTSSSLAAFIYIFFAAASHP